ncbi:MAG: polysaccharide deacetylase family protein [Bacteroidales bacterium]|nr:polysaccharide deacetylase family protein [Bacteroidales bacterium]MDD3860587.1 polysaccharide deacetylase family protein [Bacteroidales bacterium]
MILMYHNIDEKEGFNTVSLSNFKSQLEYIKNSNTYQILSLDEYVDNLHSAKYKNPLSISFDDAYVSFTKYVLPVIKSLELPVSLFIPTAYVGKSNVWDTKNGYPEIKILSWEELKALSNEKLISFGSHGVNHHSHAKLNNEQDFEEISNSKNIIKEQIGVEVNYYSFPFGQKKDINKYSLENLQKCGYKASLSTIWARSNSLKDLYSLKRIEISGDDDLNSFIDKTESNIDVRYFKQKLKNVLYKTKILR